MAALWKTLEVGNVLLTAPRRWGKSSVMAALADAPQPGWSVAMADFEYVEHPAEFLTELVALLLLDDPVARLLKQATRAPGALARWVAVVSPELAFSRPEIGELKVRLGKALPSTAAWPELTEELLALMSKREGSLLIIIDEFPMMIGNFIQRDRDSAIHFLKWFRAQRQRLPGHIRFLLGGSVNIEPVLEGLGVVALLNDLERFHLQPMEREKSIRFVREVLAGEGCEAEEDAIITITDAIGTGVHFFLQVLLSECISEARRRNTTLTADQVRSAYEQRVLGPFSRGRFSHYQSRLKSNYGPLEQPARIVLGHLAETESATLQELRQVLVIASFADVPASDVVARLESDFYVTVQRGAVSFSSRFLRDWWRLNAPAVVSLR
ncbi:MAG TPA: hypothetical protein VFA20_18165 [Myxococcaceae bacterium]|nr:hypothetical protein [Myxococcaceae bacterium]